MSKYAGEKHLYLMLLICGVSFVMSKYKSKSDLWLSNVQLNKSCFDVNNSFSNNTQDPFPTMSSQGYRLEIVRFHIFKSLSGPGDRSDHCLVLSLYDSVTQPVIHQVTNNVLQTTLNFIQSYK